MDMALDESRQHQLAGEVDAARRRCGGIGSRGDRAEAAVGDGEVGKPAIGESGVEKMSLVHDAIH
jgi:hypothetical protein